MADILMLEPDTILGETYRMTLEHAGHTYRRVVSAQEAVYEVDEHEPDVIIVELQLVAHSGIEFLYELRSYAEWQHIPVLIHSIIPPCEFEDSMSLLRDQLGVRSYLYKPHTSLQGLLRAVREITTVPAVVEDELPAGDLLPSLSLGDSLATT